MGSERPLQCGRSDTQKTAAEWDELIKKPRDAKCLLMVIKALTENPYSITNSNSADGNVIVLSRAELVSQAIDKLFKFSIDIERFLERFSEFETRLENRDDVIDAKLKLIDEIKKRNREDELEKLHSFLESHSDFLPTGTILSDLPKIQRQIDILKGRVGNVLPPAHGEIDTNLNLKPKPTPTPSIDVLILKFVELAVKKVGGSPDYHQALLFETLNDYPSLNKVSLVKAIIEDMQNPDKNGTPYLVIITERVREALERQGLHIV